MNVQLLQARTLFNVCTFAMLFGCSKPEVTKEIAPPVLSRVVQAAHHGEIAVYAGDVRARHENDLAFRIGGNVVSRNVEAGSIVRKGQLLASLDPQDVLLQGQSARAQTAVADADLTWARAELDRYQVLRAKNFVSRAVLDQKKQAFDAAAAKLLQTVGAVMGGLIVATALTPLFLPSLYAAWFRVRPPGG